MCHTNCCLKSHSRKFSLHTCFEVRKNIKGRCFYRQNSIEDVVCWSTAEWSMLCILIPYISIFHCLPAWTNTRWFIGMEWNDMQYIKESCDQFVLLLFSDIWPLEGDINPQCNYPDRLLPRKYVAKKIFHIKCIDLQKRTGTFMHSIYITYNHSKTDSILFVIEFTIKAKHFCISPDFPSSAVCTVSVILWLSGVSW